MTSLTVYGINHSPLCKLDEDTLVGCRSNLPNFVQCLFLNWLESICTFQCTLNAVDSVANP